MPVAWHGDLYLRLIRNHLQDKRFSEEELKDIFSQVLVGLAYCHERKVCHRDIKPHNIIFRSDNEALLTDFGTAKAVLEEEDDMTSTGRMGTPVYMAPEIAKQRGRKRVPYDPFAADMWSLGVTIY